MIDNDDVEFAILAWPAVGPWSLALGIVVIGFMAFVACENEEECAQRECGKDTKAMIVNNECVCVGKPSTP
jgi:hypothetical protein